MAVIKRKIRLGRSVVSLKRLTTNYIVSAVTSKYCVYYKDNPYKDPNDHPLAVVGHIVLTFSDGSKDTIG